MQKLRHDKNYVIALNFSANRMINRDIDSLFKPLNWVVALTLNLLFSRLQKAIFGYFYQKIGGFYLPLTEL